MEDTFRKDLTEGSVDKKLIVFALPFLLAQFLQALYSIADMLVVGKFMGDYGITAVNNSSTISMFITFLISGFALSGTVLVAQYIGAKKEEEAKKTIGTIFVIFIIASIVITAIGLIITPNLLRLINIPSESYIEAVNYLRVCFGGTIFICGYNAVSAILRGLGDSVRPLFFVFIATICNIILDVLFVGVMKMGAGGAALATIISQGLSFFLAIFTLFKQNFIFDFKPKSFVIDKSKVPLIIIIGLPSAIQSTIVNLAFLFIISEINLYGLSAATAVGICGKIDSFAVLPTVAISQAVASMAGQNLGAGKIDRARKTLFSGVRLSLIIGIIMFFIIRLNGRNIIGLFKCNEETLEIGLMYIRYATFAYLGNSVVFIFSGFATGSGNSIFATINALTNMIFARVALIFVFTRFLNLGLFGIFLAIGISQYAGIIPSSIFYFSGTWKKSFINKKTGIA